MHSVVRKVGGTAWPTDLELIAVLRRLRRMGGGYRIDSRTAA